MRLELHLVILSLIQKLQKKKILSEIQRLNDDQSVHGILIQYPVPSHISSYKLMSSIKPEKDVEGFHPYNLGRTLLGNESIIPCTPYSVLTILEHEKVKLKGNDICIVNHSIVVGKPLSSILLNRDATVSICNVFTKDMKKYTTNADILISGAGVPKLIKKEARLGLYTFCLYSSMG